MNRRQKDKLTLIFDFDGTLAQTLPVMWKTYNQIAPSFNLPTITWEKALSLRDRGVRRLTKEYRVSPLKLLRLSQAITKAMKNKILQVKPAKGIRAVLRDIRKKNIKAGILTSNSKENVIAFLKNSDLESFDFIYSESNLLGKAPAIKKIIKKEKLAPRSVIYIGDETRDVAAAHKAGARAIAVTWGLNSRTKLRNKKPDWIIDHPQELIKVINRLD